jgi:hypothetical protein
MDCAKASKLDVDETNVRLVLENPKDARQPCVKKCLYRAIDLLDKNFKFNVSLKLIIN